MSFLSNPLGDIFINAREKKGLTQEELGDLMGRGQSWISAIEGYRMPKFDEGIRLCMLLDLNPIDVYNEMIKKLKKE